MEAAYLSTGLPADGLQVLVAEIGVAEAERCILHRKQKPIGQCTVCWSNVVCGGR
jgi:hypothetical protein